MTVLSPPVTLERRALAPDLARGFMLLLIAVANATGVVFGGEMSGQPHPHGLERVANLFLFVAVHARAYPMFAMLFGYGIVQLARSRRERGLTEAETRRVLRRRYRWMFGFGLVHAALLYSGDFLGAYGLVGLVATLLLLRERRWVDRLAIGLWVLYVPYALVAGLLVVHGLMSGHGPSVGLPVHPTASLQATSYLSATLDRLHEWPAHTLTAFGVITIAWLGMVAARRRILEDAAQHVTLLRRVAVVSLAIAFLGGLPLGLVGAGVLHPDAVTASHMTWLSGLSGMFGGPGYLAVFGLLAARLDRHPLAPTTQIQAEDRHPTGQSVTRKPMQVAVDAVVALGRRSLSGYLFQSVAWLVLFAPYTLNLQHRFGSPVFTGFVVAVIVWLVSVVAAARMGSRPGPAERLLRRLSEPRPTIEP